MNHRLQIQRIITKVHQAKSALYLDPTLMSSKNVTAQCGHLNEATKMLKQLMEALPASASDPETEADRS